MVDFVLKKSKRAKKVRIVVRPNGEVLVTVPQRLPNFIAKKFVEANSDWILQQVKEFKQVRIENDRKGIPNILTTAQRKKEYEEKKEEARSILTERVRVLSLLYGYTYGRISIRNQKTRWGSCSKAGNLNFNYTVAFLPDAIRDYVVVHELCHLKEFNHSKKFWNLVAVGSPKYKEIRVAMRKLGGVLG